VDTSHEKAEITQKKRGWRRVTIPRWFGSVDPESYTLHIRKKGYRATEANDYPEEDSFEQVNLGTQERKIKTQGSTKQGEDTGECLRRERWDRKKKETIRGLGLVKGKKSARRTSKRLVD